MFHENGKLTSIFSSEKTLREFHIWRYLFTYKNSRELKEAKPLTLLGRLGTLLIPYVINLYKSPWDSFFITLSWYCDMIYSFAYRFRTIIISIGRIYCP